MRIFTKIGSAFVENDFMYKSFKWNWTKFALLVGGGTMVVGHLS